MKLVLAAAVIAILGAPLWLWPILQDGTLNIGQPALIAATGAVLLPVFCIYTLVGPDYFSQGAQIGFLATALTVILAAALVAFITPQNGGWFLAAALTAATIAAMATFGRRAFYGPDPLDEDDP